MSKSHRTPNTRDTGIQHKNYIGDMVVYKTIDYKRYKCGFSNCDLDITDDFSAPPFVHSNSAEPYPFRCCGLCNVRKVIPLRMLQSHLAKNPITSSSPSPA